jgi:hypothetical protein
MDLLLAKDGSGGLAGPGGPPALMPGLSPDSISAARDAPGPWSGGVCLRADIVF